jgi:CheY-like chemotaxis protein
MDAKTVLLVEDNAEDEFLVTRAFKRTKLPINMIVARDGQEAVDYVFCTGAFVKRKFADVPDLVLLDLDLPKINGHEVLSYLRADQRMRMVPVVVFTATSDEHDRLTAYQLGANSYVVKPADGSKIGSVIENLCRYWFSLNSALRSPTYADL